MISRAVETFEDHEQEWDYADDLRNQHDDVEEAPPAPATVTNKNFKRVASLNVIHDLPDLDLVDDNLGGADSAPHRERRSLYEETEKKKEDEVEECAANNDARRHNGFTLTNFLSPEECNSILSAAEPLLTDVSGLFPATYRAADRALVRCPKLAKSLFRRLTHYLTRDDIRGRVPMCFGHTGVWFPHSVNEVMKISRYQKGGAFADHRDGPWIPCENYGSVFTVLIYLNDDFVGGETTFILEQSVAMDLGESAVRKRHRAGVHPQRGAMVLFEHDALHSGQLVESGVKYILRTEVIFRRHYTLMHFSKDMYAYVDDAEYKKMRDMYVASTEAASAGRTQEFVDLYQQVIAAQLCARERETVCEHNNDVVLYTKLPDDVTQHILLYVPDRDLCHGLMLASRACYYGTLQCSVWESKIKLLTLNEQPQREVAYDLSVPSAAVTDWFSVYAALRSPLPKMERDIVSLWPLPSGSLAMDWSGGVKRKLAMLPRTYSGPTYESVAWHMHMPDRARYSFKKYDNDFEIIEVDNVVKWEVLGKALVDRVSACDVGPTVVVVAAHPSWGPTNCADGAAGLMESILCRVIAFVPVAVLAVQDLINNKRFSQDPRVHSRSQLQSYSVFLEEVSSNSEGGEWWRCEVDATGTKLLSAAQCGGSPGLDAELHNLDDSVCPVMVSARMEDAVANSDEDADNPVVEMMVARGFYPASVLRGAQLFATTRPEFRAWYIYHSTAMSFRIIYPSKANVTGSY
eukprot:PhM_4_TR15619/c0_g4_i1/m.68469